MLFYQGDRYLWPHCCMNNFYISHRSLCAPTYSFWVIGSMLISPFRISSWIDTVCNIVTCWVNFGKKNSCINMNYNYPATMYRNFVCPNVLISGIKIYIYKFCLWTFQGHNEKLQIIPEILIFGENKFRMAWFILNMYINQWLKTHIRFGSPEPYA